MFKDNRRKSFYRLLTSVSASALMLGSVNGVAAQDEDDDGLEEITVTATKRAKGLQDVAQSISAITDETIEREGLLSLQDYARSIPSLTFFAPQPGRNQIVFRGVSTGANQFRTDSSTSVYLDEQPLTSISQQVDPWMIDIERIEALPGPQGTLFGSSSQSGTLRYITNKPNASELGGKVEASIGTTKGGEISHDLSAVLNIPLSDNLAIRAVGYTVQHGGYIDNKVGQGLSGIYDNSDIAEDDFNDWGVDGARLSAKWDISDRWSVLATAIYQKSKSSGDWKSDPSIGEYSIVRFNDDFRNDSWWSTALTINGDLGFADLVSSTTYMERKVSYLYDGSSYDAWRSNYHATYSLYNTNDRKSYTFNDQDQKRFTQEVRLTSKGDSRFEWMIGAFYEKVEDQWLWGTKTPDYASTNSYAYANYWSCYYAYYDSNFQCPIDASENIYYGQFFTRTVSQKAIFGEVGYQITDNFKATFGMRWFEFERERLESNQWPYGFPPLGYNGASAFFGGTDDVSGKQSDTVYKVGLEYKIDDDRMLYALYSQGFRLGGYNSLRAADAGFVEREYMADRLENYELGLKSRFFDKAMTLNASLFHMKWSDIQTSIWDPNTWWLNGNTNGGGAKSTGIEITVDYQINENWRINSNIFYADAKLTDPILNGSGNIDVPAGSKMAFSPDSKYSIGVEYTIPDAMFGADFWVRYDFWGQSSQLQNIYDGTTVPSYDESSLKAGFWKDDDWDITLAIDNLFDQRNISSWDTGSNYISDFFGTDMYRNMENINRPRTIWLTVRKRL